MSEQFKYLSESEMKMINKLYERVEKHVFVYPDPTGDLGPCLRIKHPDVYKNKVETICGTRVHLYAYTIAFMHENHKIVNRVEFPDLTLSHICGNRNKGGVSRCTQLGHICLEDQNDNDDRQLCRVCKTCIETRCLFRPDLYEMLIIDLHPPIITIQSFYMSIALLVLLQQQ